MESAHFITPEWEMKNPVWLTRPVYEQHTSTQLAEKLQEEATEWNLEKPRTIAVTTDNARNIVNAGNEAGLGPQIACFAHTLNFVSQKAMAVVPNPYQTMTPIPRNILNRDLYVPLHPYYEVISFVCS